MSDTILIVGHGSQKKAGNVEIEEFATKWRERQPDWAIELCFIEFAEVLLDDGLDRAAHGAGHGGRVLVVPLILNAAGHVKMEIPHHIDKARTRHSNTEFIYCAHLGACEPISKIMGRRLKQAMRELDNPDPKTTGVILLGRGSSDALANGEVAKLARWLYETAEHELVDTAFTGVTHPRLELQAQRQTKLGMTQIVILPYYLFNGVLIERIKRQISHLEALYPGVRFARGEYIGFEDEIFDLLTTRVREAGEATAVMPCDGCKYRKIAKTSGDHDHHHSHEAAE